MMTMILLHLDLAAAAVERWQSRLVLRSLAPRSILPCFIN